MTEAKKAREFWIQKGSFSLMIVGDEVGFPEFSSKPFKVIEYSALQALIDENEKLKEKVKVLEMRKEHDHKNILALEHMQIRRDADIRRLRGITLSENEKKYVHEDIEEYATMSETKHREALQFYIDCNSYKHKLYEKERNENTKLVEQLKKAEDVIKKIYKEFFGGTWPQEKWTIELCKAYLKEQG